MLFGSCFIYNQIQHFFVEVIIILFPLWNGFLLHAILSSSQTCKCSSTQNQLKCSLWQAREQKEERSIHLTTACQTHSSRLTANPVEPGAWAESWRMMSLLRLTRVWPALLRIQIRGGKGQMSYDGRYWCWRFSEGTKKDMTASQFAAQSQRLWPP